MIWPFENDTSAVTRRLSNARIGQNRFRKPNEYAASTAYQGIFQNLSQEKGIAMSMVCSDETTMQLSNITLVAALKPEHHPLFMPWPPFCMWDIYSSLQASDKGYNLYMDFRHRKQEMPCASFTLKIFFLIELGGFLYINFGKRECRFFFLYAKIIK